MAPVRKPFQGSWNIIRFNWHFYILAAAGILLLFLIAVLAPDFQFYCLMLVVLVGLAIAGSLAISWYIYDHSDLYDLPWIRSVSSQPNATLINIHAGFDETSEILRAQILHDRFLIFDFYDPLLHTEISIKRARNAYPPHPETRSISTRRIPMEDKTADLIFIIFTAHEIRNQKERILFFSELRRIMKSDAQIFVTEHLRDLPNFLAYQIGFLHFYSRRNWMDVFRRAGLKISKEFKTTPFVTTYMLTPL
ncbi:hypothetical protein GCM10027051_10900 [Niabella terrae]